MQKNQDRRKKVEEYKYRPVQTFGKCSCAGISGYDCLFSDAVFSGLFLIYAALCFFTLDGLEFMNVFTDGAREFGKYPAGVYGEKILLFATFFVPYALVQYYPLIYILERRTSIGYVVLPLVACWFLLPALELWKFGVRNYKSSGA